MELQLIGLTIDFLGTVLLLLFLDPVMTEKKINEKKVPQEKVMKRYLMKRHFALLVIVLGFIIQLIALLQK